MCGGTIEFEPGTTVGTCDSCGTKQTLPRLDDERRANLYDRANHFRRNNEFDKAAGIYEQILTEDTTDAEAYWSLVLCQYGIEYVEDPATHKRIPTVNRAQFTSIFDDDNYKSALQYADAYQRVLYEQEANEINEIQKGILAISQREDPFDDFICYKETDQNGRRTPDSVLANDLYHQLIQEGFKVFFARITLEDKLGTAYEPYIFAALNSAKVMVVLGTRHEYFNAVWVKNEWSRYLTLVKKSGGKKILIPAYKDMDPYDLPEEFSHLQAQDMSKLGFMQDLLRGIKKIVTAETPKQTVKETVVVGANPNIQPLLERAFMFLEDGNWEEADTYCERVLDQDPKNAQAYLGKLMAELKVTHQDALADCDQSFDSNGNYQKIVRYGDDNTKSKLIGYIELINERNEKKRLTGLYESAVEAMKRAATEEQYKNAAAGFKTLSGFQNADELADQCLEKAEVCRKNEIYNSARGQKNKGTVESLETAIQIFGKITGWKDADEQINICRHEIERIKDWQETERVEKERQQKIRSIAAKKAAKKRKIVIAIVAILAVVGVTAFFLLTKVVIPNSRYNAALDLYNDGKYEEAISSFEALNGYKDSADQINNCRKAILDKDYNAAVEYFNSEKYEEAIEAFTVLDGYKDSIEIIEKAARELEYLAAVGLYNSGEYEEALSAFENMDDFKDSAEQIIRCEAAIQEEEYKVAMELYSAGKYEEAIKAFKAMDGYKDSAGFITKCEEEAREANYQSALALVDSGQLYEAYNAFRILSDYKDSQDQIDKTRELMLKNAKVGDTVVFGHFSQLQAYNEWLVLDKQDEKLLILSKYGIGRRRAYHSEYGIITWEKCDLRAWLNGVYITNAFSDYEQSMILYTKNENPNNPKYGMTGGPDTTDKAFLLSVDDVNNYLPRSALRQMRSPNGVLCVEWWLRTPGYSFNASEADISGSYSATVIKKDGFIDYYGHGNALFDGELSLVSDVAVRPALWIDITGI